MTPKKPTYITIRVSNSCPTTKKYYINRHKLAYWLWKAGFSYSDIAHVLEINVRTVSKYITRPSKYLTVHHIQRLAQALEVKPVEVFHVVYNGQLP